MPPFTWSDWRPTGLSLTPAVLAETLDGGQAFRWRCDESDIWTGIWSSHVVRLRLSSQGSLAWSALQDAPDGAAAINRYLGIDRDFPALTDRLPWRSDPHLATCLATFPGLRIPRQPFGETLLCFLCSATKQIVQIKEMVALLAANHGEKICRTGSPALSVSNEPTHRRTGEPPVPTIHTLPTWEKIAGIPEETLRKCLLGFRARYIAASAKYIAARPGWLDETEALPYAAAKARLLELPGVGEKVADCVLLFGAGKLEAFPVDTWILKAMERRYGLTGWSPAQIAHFGRTHFGPLAGLAQQYLFAYERAQARLEPRSASQRPVSMGKN
ncbi:MAG: DNA-binding protein [Cephaloticoccus sp.]|nr:DNA-binding protein [Cephaloticoccus sp.]